MASDSLYNASAGLAGTASRKSDEGAKGKKNYCGGRCLIYCEIFVCM